MRSRSLNLCLLALLFLPFESTAQVAGWGHLGSQLLGVQIDSQGNATAEVLSSLGAVDPITPGPDGVLYAVGTGFEPELLEVELATGDVTSVGPIFPVPTTPTYADLAFDDDGTLWFAHGERLYQLDPASGAATLVADVPGLLRLSHHGGTLYGLLLDPPEQTIQFAEIDSAGVATPLATLPEFGFDGAFVTFPLSLDFDGAGGAWIHAWRSTAIIDPPLIEPRFLYYADPSSGDPGRLVDPDGLLLNDFAVDRLPEGSIAEVPALSLLGSLMLALGLGAAGWRRRGAL